MRRGIIYLLLLLFSAKMIAADIKLTSLRVDIRNKAALQRGAKFFMNYCSGCHSLRYMRYNRMAEDLGLITFDGRLDEKLLMNNLVFTTAKPHDPIEISLPEVDARQWFGKVPPDLSLSARQRGQDWLYTFLKSFYIDKKRPFGSNNLLVPDSAMPNILAPLQGEVIAVKKFKKDEVIQQLFLKEKGEVSPQQFDLALQDLVTFLVYVGEPAKLVRYRLGVAVLIFLSVFLILGYQLKKYYWRDIS